MDGVGYILFGCILCLLVNPALAQPNVRPHVIQGTVFLNEQPIGAGVSVEASVGGEVVATTETTTDGGFVLEIPGDRSTEGSSISVAVSGFSGGITSTWATGKNEFIDIQVSAPAETRLTSTSTTVKERSLLPSGSGGGGAGWTVIVGGLLLVGSAVAVIVLWKKFS